MDSTAVATLPALPFAHRPVADMPGHWLLASLGKKVLRPGGRELTDKMIGALPLAGADVVELAPGLGLTARLLLERGPASYMGVDEEPAAVAITGAAIEHAGSLVNSSAKQTGREDASCDVVVNEAMLTMNTDRTKREIIGEVARILRPGGRYAFHELALAPDDLDPDLASTIRKDLARSIKVNARPLTVAEWRGMLTDAGFEVDQVFTTDMALLEVRRLIADEGVGGTLRIGWASIIRRGALTRLLGMWKTFRRYRKSMIAVSIVARKPLA